MAINQRNKKICLIILVLLNFLTAFGQTEFFITVNPNNGSFTEIDSLIGVRWITTGPNFTTFDKNAHRFFFRGSDAGMNWHLFSIDAITGNIISYPTFPIVSDPADNVIELQYDNSSNILYGLHWDSSESREYFVSINPTSGIFTIIDSIPGVEWIATLPHFTTFDENNRRFIFKGGDNSGNFYLYSIDVVTGSVISNPPFPVLSDPSDNVVELKYDNSSNTLYGLHWDNSENTEYFVSIDPATGMFTKINSLPGVRWISTYGHYSVFDEINQRFIFNGGDNIGNWYLYTIDSNTGNIISSPLFPVLSDPSDNIVKLQFDNSSGILYALHWDANTVNGIFNNEEDDHIFNLHPNPFSDYTKINLDKSYSEITIFIYNSSGQVVRKETRYNSAAIKIQKDNLSNGTYFISLVCDHQNIGIKKIIVE